MLIEVGMTRRAVANLRRAPWFSILVAVLAVVGVVGFMVWRRVTDQPDLRLVDLAVYRSAGESLLTGRPVYDYLTPLPQFLPFTYPPFAAVVAIPLALIPSMAANWLWSIATIAVLGWIVLVSFRPLFRRVPVPWRPIAVAAVICAMAWLWPVRDCIRFGQVGIFLAGLCLADCVIARPRWPRGVLIGFATAIKLTPGVFIIYLWVSGRRRAAVNAAITTAVLEVAAAVISPKASWAYWTDYLFNSGRLGDNSGTSNQSLRGMFDRVLIPHAATAAYVVSVLVLVVLALRWARSASVRGDEIRAVAIIGLMSVLVSPVSWIHHLSGWVPIAVGVILGAGYSRYRWAGAVVLTALFTPPIPWWSNGLYRDDLPYFMARIVEDAFGLLALIVIFVLGRSAALRTPQPAPTEPRQHVRS